MSASPPSQKGEGAKTVSPSLSSFRKLTVDVQYCTNCEIHLPEERHSSLRFQQEFDRVKKRLNHYDIAVRKKPIPSYLVKKSPYAAINSYYNIDKQCEETFPQVGAFEVYFLQRKIYSKISTGKWPNIDNLILTVYKMALQNHAFQKVVDAGEQKRKKARPIEQIVHSLMSREGTLQHIDVTSLKTSIDRYDKYKRRLRNNEIQLTTFHQPVDESQQRPNTTYVRRRQFQIKPELGSLMQNYTGGHKATNQDTFNGFPLDIQEQAKRTLSKKAAYRMACLDYSLSKNVTSQQGRRKNRSLSKNGYYLGAYLQRLGPVNNQKRESIDRKKSRLRYKLMEKQKKQGATTEQKRGEWKVQDKEIHLQQMERLLNLDIQD